MVVKLVLKRKNENIQIWSRYSLFKNTGCRLPASSSAALSHVPDLHVSLANNLRWLFVAVRSYSRHAHCLMKWSRFIISFIWNNKTNKSLLRHDIKRFPHCWPLPSARRESHTTPQIQGPVRWSFAISVVLSCESAVEQTIKSLWF